MFSATLLFLASALAALLAHELGHATAAQTLNLPWKLIVTRHGPGIRVGADTIRLTRQQIIVTAASGPAASLAFAVAIWAASPLAAIISLELAFWNLILPRSDGALILHAVRG